MIRSPEAEALLRKGNAFLRMELCKPQPGTTATRLLVNAAAADEGNAAPTAGAAAHAAAIAAFVNTFKQIEDADGDDALTLAKSLAEWFIDPAAGMREDGSGAILSEKEPADMATQAACAYAFALLAEAPQGSSVALGGAGGGTGSGGGSVSDLLMSILEPGVSATTHMVMQVSLLVMFVCLGLMIMIYGPNIHLIVMFSLGIGLVFSYFLFMSALSELGDDDLPGGLEGNAVPKTEAKLEGAKQQQQQKKGGKAKKAD